MNTPQQAPAGNRLALWLNTRKTAANQPDYKGSIEITYELLQELTAAFNAGQYEQDYHGRPIIKLDMAVYAQPPNQDPKQPVMKGGLSTLAETQESARIRAQYRQQAQNGGMPQAAPQQFQAPAPAAPAPQQYQPAPVAQAAPVAAPPAPAPAPAAPAPVAPPMPGAIHGQPPAQPAFQVPQGF